MSCVLSACIAGVVPAAVGGKPLLGTVAAAWSATIAVAADHVPNILAFGPNAYVCFVYSGRGTGPGTAFGIQAAIALLERRPEELPTVPTRHYSERFTNVKAVYYALGATLVHAISPPPRAGAKR